MARISTYIIDTNVTASDKWIGTDSSGSRTKNFSAEGVAVYLNRTNAVGIAGQINYLFQTDLTDGRQTGTISFEAGGGDGASFADITTLLASNKRAGNQLVNKFLENLADGYIILFKLSDINTFGIYRLITVEIHETYSTFYVLTMELVNSNGELESGEYYGIGAYPEEGADKHYAYTQSSASASWDIEHNMNKKPAVTVVNASDQVIIGDITYTDLNNINIAFKTAITGKTYMN